tara:strand:+ start:246 stop:548 length:303 start_codon:yes stop_codon:yes gene_type:complete
MAKETMLYFSKDDNERAIYPARNFLGVDMTDATSMQISFLKEDGSLDAAIVDLTIASGKAKEAAEVLAGALAGQSRGLTIVADTENSNFLYPFTEIVTIT